MPKVSFIRDPSLVLYLPLYESDGDVFMSRDAYGHTCTVTDATWGMQGRTFSGSENIDCGDGTSLDLTADFTIEVWVNASAFDSAPAATFICGRDDGAGRNFWMQCVGDYLNVVVLIGGSVKGLTDTTIQLSTGNWYHLIGVRDGNTLRTFVNTVAGDTLATGAGATDNDDVSLVIGETAGGTKGWEGIIGEVRGYNRALNPLEIQHNYLSTKWRFQ